MTEDIDREEQQEPEDHLMRCAACGGDVYDCACDCRRIDDPSPEEILYWQEQERQYEEDLWSAAFNGPIAP